MNELLQVALRAIGVVLPGAGFWFWVELHSGVPAGDFGTYLGAMAISMLVAAVWSVIDTWRAPIRKVLIRWAATAFVVGGGIALVSTLMAPGTPPGLDRMTDVVGLLLFHGVPLLVAAGVSVAIAHDQRILRDHRDSRRG
jgi:hypothetical protein